MNPTRQLTNLSGNHTVQIWPNETSQVDLVTRYIKDGLLNGEAVIVIAKSALRKALKVKMDTFSFNGQNLQDLQDQDQIRFFDAEFLLLNLMSDEGLEEKAFQEFVASPMYKAQLNYRKVRVFSEMVDILWKQNQYDMALQLEGFWNELSNTQEFSFLRTYSLDKQDPNTHEDILERICKDLSHLIPMEDHDLIEHGMNEETLNVFGVA
ncbi:MEDS domain-containing protein [Nitrosomonas sp. Nm166]|uniref:MEDS domain-containing protein n=1 Tax=Nitrosomonas sp. Nm166 TaxID=1881054 RepID=UPI0008EF34F1|nr:MEDS domain-containing protein [Nitrosomonas sp. Nm166]SFF14331.1 MEDS: MEthanogen/methylotroph, DcmR Sensory domain [Nitrosomonas sp. Nm166]